jgi:hypothetical protein
MSKKDNKPELPLPDSIVSADARAKKIREEAAQIEAEQAARDAQQAERKAQATLAAHRAEDEYVNKVALVSSEETIESLHERIRKMRAEAQPGPEVPPVPQYTARQRAELEAEQEAGRKALAKHQAEFERTREIRERYLAEEKNRKGVVEARTTPVFTPNPKGDEKFPVSAATIK